LDARALWTIVLASRLGIEVLGMHILEVN